MEYSTASALLKGYLCFSVSFCPLTVEGTHIRGNLLVFSPPALPQECPVPGKVDPHLPGCRKTLRELQLRIACLEPDAHTASMAPRTLETHADLLPSCAQDWGLVGQRGFPVVSEYQETETV